MRLICQEGQESRYIKCHMTLNRGLSLVSTSDLFYENLQSNTGSTIDSLGEKYYDTIESKANRIVNFNNRRDAALIAWEFNQLTKPDFLPLGAPTWEYRNEMYDCYAATIGFDDSIERREQCRNDITEVTSRYLRDREELVWDESREISSQENWGQTTVNL